MKKLFSICLFVLMAISLHAQTTYMNVKVKAGSKARFMRVENGLFQIPASEIDSIFFEKLWSGVLKPVDMGLPSGLKWANVNYGANKATEKGVPVPWGVAGGNVYEGEDDIAGGKYDPVTYDWGAPWRMPTQEEMQALIDGCEKVWVENGDSLGVLFKSPNGAEIFLPATDYYNESGEAQEKSDRGYYWTSKARGESEAWNFCFSSSGDTVSVKRFKEERTYGLFVRPVYEEKPPVQVTVDKPSITKLTYGTALFNLNYTVSDKSVQVTCGVQIQKKGTNKWETEYNYSGTVSFTNISSETEYYYRGFAVVNSDTIFNPDDENYPTFKTKALPTPTVMLVSKTADGATFKLSISENDPSSPIKDYGVEYAKLKSDSTWTNWEVKKADADGVVELTGLDSLTTYRYRGYLKYIYTKYDKESDFDTFTTLKPSKYFKPDSFVDLGLPSKTLWAPFNLGATSELDKGKFFGWGDPTGELTTTSSGAYATPIVPPADLTSLDSLAYRAHPDDTVDTKVLRSQWDIVHVDFGDGYHLPTMKQFKELNQCQIEFIGNYKESGIAGWLVHGIGKCKDNSVFFPCCGVREMVNPDGTEKVNSESATFYWTSQLDDGNQLEDGTGFYGQAIFVKIESGSVNCFTNYKARGMSIRPVFDGNNNSGPVNPDDDPATTIAKTLADGSIVPQDGVDLGLPSGNKWASWNLGAKQKEGDMGQYFAWGETKSKEGAFTNDTFVAECKGAKYPNTSFFGTYKLLPKYDAANVLWGEGWYMPTEDDFNELMENVNMAWDDGLVLTSKINGKSIFLPAGGYKSGTDIRDDGTLNYWTSSVWTSGTNSDKMNYAKCLYYASIADGTPGTFNYRWCGLLIRPVKK